MRERPWLAAVLAVLLLTPTSLQAAPTSQERDAPPAIGEVSGQAAAGIPLRLIAFSVVPPLAAAQELGFLADEGLVVTVDTTSSSAEQMQGFAAGRWDVAHTLFDNLLAAAGRDGVQA